MMSIKTIQKVACVGRELIEKSQKIDLKQALVEI